MSKITTGDSPETPFRALARRAGLTVSMASRILGKDLRTGRRLASGKPELASDGTIRRKALELSLPDLLVMEMLADENEKALADEAAGRKGRWPLRDRAMNALPQPLRRPSSASREGAGA